MTTDHRPETLHHHDITPTGYTCTTCIQGWVRRVNEYRDRLEEATTLLRLWADDDPNARGRTARFLHGVDDGS